MSDVPEARVPRSVESLKKEAKRWLAAIRDGEPAARERFSRAFPDGPAEPGLRHVQRALALEHGHDGWTRLTDVIHAHAARSRDSTGAPQSRYDDAVDALLDAYRTGTPEAMERHYRLTWHRRPWSAMRAYVRLDLGKPAQERDGEVDISLDDARRLVASEHGFVDWDELTTHARLTAAHATGPLKPVRVTTGVDDDERTVATARDWDAVVDALRAHPEASLRAAGQMTDDALRRVAHVEGLRSLDLGGSKALTDEGVRHLAHAPALEALDLSGTGVTDRGLAVVAALPRLRRISLAGTRVTDAGVAALADCRALRRVDLSWTATGDGAVAAMAGMPDLHDLRTGVHLTDAGLPSLHEIPAFKTWSGGETHVALMTYDALPNRLVLRGRLTDRGMEALRGLDGLFGLNLDDSTLPLTSAAIEPLVELPKLGHLSVDAKDDWMPIIARIPRLRFLGAQDTTAGDDGFEALSASRSIEYIWGRRCHNLRGRGFRSLARMPALRGLSVSCRNVDDAGLSALPSFPALRELMPMDVPDAGYRHIGSCARLERLILMYCRDTTDRATEHVARLPSLAEYFNSYTAITDRTPELLSTMDSLERITFDACHGLTDRGVEKLARLPRLREIRVAGRGVTSSLAKAFPPTVVVRVGG